MKSPALLKSVCVPDTMFHVSSCHSTTLGAARYLKVSLAPEGILQYTQAYTLYSYNTNNRRGCCVSSSEYMFGVLLRAFSSGILDFSTTYLSHTQLVICLSRCLQCCMPVQLRVWLCTAHAWFFISQYESWMSQSPPFVALSYHTAISIS